jgi:hypothetical protein
MITQTTTQETYSEAAARIAEKHPHLANMAAHALAIVEAGKVHPTRDGAIVFSEAGRDRYEVAITPDGPTCGCPAFSHRPAVINGRRYCKHLMALGIYNRVKGS